MSFILYYIDVVDQVGSCNRLVIEVGLDRRIEEGALSKLGWSKSVLL